MSQNKNWKTCATLFSNCLGVFQGGGCRAIAYAGAYEEAIKKGISFSEVAGTSAGAIFAALIAAGATPEFINKIAYSDELKNIPKPIVEEKKAHWFLLLVLRIIIWSKKIRRFFSSWKTSQTNSSDVLNHTAIKNIKRSLRALTHQYGVFKSDNIKNTVNIWLKELTGKEDVTFQELKLPLYVFASDIRNKKCKIWSKDDTPDISVATAVAASCCIPFYFSPIRMSIADGSESIYVDGGMLSNRPNFIAKDKPNYFQTLSFKLESNESDPKDLPSYVMSLVDTIIYGADELQHKQIGIEDETFGKQKVNEVGINVGNVSAIDFSMLNPNEVNKLLQAGKKAMERFIQKTDSDLSRDDFREYAVTPRRMLHDQEQMYNQVAFWSYETYETIYVSDRNFDWVWPMFPTIVSWINASTSVIVYYDQNCDSSNDEAQGAKKRLIESLGCKTHPVPPEKLIQGFFFCKSSDFKCVVFEDSHADQSTGFKAKVYNDTVDSQFIKVIMERLGIDDDNSHPEALSLKKLDKNTAFELLKDIPQYKNAHFKFEDVPISKLHFLKDTVRSLKYKELRHIKHLYDNSGIPLYHLSKLIMNDGKESIMTPIIVEDNPHHGLIVIKGNARCLKLHKDNPEIDAVPAIVVSDIDSAFTDVELYTIRDLTLSEKKNRGLVNLPAELFRGVDQAFRPNSTYLK